MTPVSLRIDEELLDRYNKLSELTHRTRTYYMQQALEQSISDLEQQYELEADLQAYMRGDMQVSSFEEVAQSLGVDY